MFFIHNMKRHNVSSTFQNLSKIIGIHFLKALLLEPLLIFPRLKFLMPNLYLRLNYYNLSKTV